MKGPRHAVCALSAVFAVACDPGLPSDVVEEATAAAAPAWSTDPLHEQLYAGERGSTSQASGDRLRLLVWLQALELDAEQLRALDQASGRVRFGFAELDAWQEEVDAEEAARLRPLHRELAALLVADPRDEAALAAVAEELGAARAAQPHPASQRWEKTRAVLDVAAELTTELRPEQHAAMRHALFLLRRRVSAHVAPTFYDGLVGMAWDAGDFASLSRIDAAGEPADLDLGGLWQMSEGTVDETASIEGLRLQLLVALAISHPGLPDAIAVIRGKADAADFVAPPEPEPEPEP